MSGEICDTFEDTCKMTPALRQTQPCQELKSVSLGCSSGISRSHLAYVVRHWALARGSISVAAGAGCQSAAAAKLQWSRPAVRRWSGSPRVRSRTSHRLRRLRVGRTQWGWATPANREGDHLEGLTRRADPWPACSGRIKSITRAHLGIPGGGRIAIVQPTCCLCPARAWPSPRAELLP